MPTRRPQGIIDDLFSAAGPYAVKAVRTSVRKFVKQQKISVANASRIRVANAKDIKNVTARNLKTGIPKKQTLRNPNSQRMPAQELFLGGKPRITNPATTKGAQKAAKAKARAQSHFPNKSAFEKAVREERKAMKLEEKK